MSETRAEMGPYKPDSGRQDTVTSTYARLRRARWPDPQIDVSEATGTSSSPLRSVGEAKRGHRRIASVRDAAIRAPLRRHVRRRPCFLCSTRVLYHVHTIHVSHVLIHVSHMFYAFHMLYALHTHDAGLSSNRNSNYHVIRLEAYHPLI